MGSMRVIIGNVLFSGNVAGFHVGAKDGSEVAQMKGNASSDRTVDFIVHCGRFEGPTDYAKAKNALELGNEYTVRFNTDKDEIIYETNLLLALLKYGYGPGPGHPGTSSYDMDTISFVFAPSSEA